MCVQKRHVLEQTEQLEPRVSALDEDLEADEEDEEEEEEQEEEEEAVRVSVCSTHLTVSSTYCIHICLCVYTIGRSYHLSHTPPPPPSLRSSVSPASQTFPQSPQRS